MKRIEFKIFAPGNKKFRRVIVHAPRYSVFTAAGVENALAQMVERVEANAPEQYRFVQVAPNAFNFVHRTRELAEKIAAELLAGAAGRDVTPPRVGSMPA